MKHNIQGKIILISLSILLFSFTKIIGQTTLPYFCGFETEEEKDGWIFVNGNSNNEWIIGNATSFIGKNALYVTSDGGLTTSYENKAGLIAAYKAFDLPAGQEYDISFDWKSLGEGSNIDVLYVCWITNPNTQINPNNTGILPSDLRVEATLHSSSFWKHETIRVNGAKGRLAFIWVNNDTDEYNPGACIDNIQIGSTTDCPAPTDLSIKEGSEPGEADLSWQGGADYYEVMYCDVRNNNWKTATPINGTQYSFSAEEEGLYAFRVRGICGNNSSIWSAYQYHLVTNAALRCINFTNFDDPSVKATYGSVQDPYAHIGVVDYGEDNIASRHTLNITPEQYDAITGYKLPTIPEGEIASIRLGNWQGTTVGTEGESISFTHEVDPLHHIMLLKYAVVLENSLFSINDQLPRFKIEILDSNDDVIDTECGLFDFVGNKNLDGWNDFAKSNYRVGKWKDWSTVGISLHEYIGETVKIRLTTTKCLYRVHFGYAYFTLDCVPSEVSGIACGENEVDSIGAPEGFSYEWTNINDRGTPLGTERFYKPPTDDKATYVCKVTSLENEKCSFELTASMLPVNPVAKFDYDYKRDDCTNMVYFTDQSWVETENGPVDRRIESYYWDFGDGEYSIRQNPQHEYKTAGKYTVRLITGINNNECESIWEETIDILPIGTVTFPIEEEICEGESIQVGSKVLFEEGVHPVYFKTADGCDSIVLVNLIVHEKQYSTYEETICYGHTLVYHGKEYDKTDEYTIKLNSIHSCDSIVTLKLTVRDEITFTLSSTQEVEGGDASIIITDAPEEYTYSINGVMNAPLDNLGAGEYTIILYTEDGCQSEEKTIIISQDCLEIEIETPAGVCPEIDKIQIPFTVISGVMDRYSITFAADGLNAGFNDILDVSVDAGDYFTIPVPNPVIPGKYQASISFSGQVCDMESYTVPVTILYPSSILAQRWNDVLAVRSTMINGGYSFSSYQWYKNNILLTGENKSYLFIPEELDIRAEYTVELIRAGEDYAVMTCGLIPERLDIDFQLKDNITVSGGNYRLISSEKGTADIYDLSGVLISQQEFNEGQNEIQAPDKQGYYIMKVILDNDNEMKTFFIHVQ